MGYTTRYQPALHALYGPVAIRETEGGATECMFGQQRNEKRASRTRPNCDLFFPWHTDTVRRHRCCPPGHVFEVETHPSAGLRTGSGIKMLHEVQAAWTQLGEMGNMVVSTPILPHYKIGDLIRKFEPPYFRCIGRDKWYTPLCYAWDEFRTLNLERL